MSLIAIFSDIHGNLPALEAVLKDIDNRNADQVYCLGDLVDFAPWTNEVIDLLRALRIPCIMGNHDERIAFNNKVVPLAKHSPEETAARIAAIDHTRKTITGINRTHLANLPRQMTITFKLKGKDFSIQLVHGSTRSNSEYLYKDHDPTDISMMLDQKGADILVAGHTHISYIRKLPFQNEGIEKYVMNSGAVGRSRSQRQLAEYLLPDMVR